MVKTIKNKRNKFNAKKKGYKKKYAKSFVGNMVGHGINPFPDRYRCKLVYSDKYYVSTGTVFNIQYRGMGAYDPAVQTAGDYPVGFYTLAQIYNKYYCAGSKIKLKILSTGPGTNLATSGQIVLYPSSTGALATNVKKAVGLPYCKNTIVGGAGGFSIAHLSNYITGKKMNGEIGNQRSNPNYIAATTTSTTGGVTIPNADFRWVIAGETISGTWDDCCVFVEIKYYIEFFDRDDDQFAEEVNTDGPTGAGDYYTGSHVVMT